MMKKYLGIIGLLLLSITAFGDVVYVNQAYTGATKDGLSWSTPFTEINAAVQAAGDSLWIAAGDYIPTDEFTGGTGDFKTISLDKTISFFGGFDGTEISFIERDWVSNKTTLKEGGTANRLFSRDANNIDIVLDGLSITEVGIILAETGGEIGHYTFRNCKIHHLTSSVMNLGDGDYLFDNVDVHHVLNPIQGINAKSLTFINSKMRDNTGSAYLNVSGQVEISNSEFIDNTLTSPLVIISNTLAGSSETVSISDNVIKRNTLSGSCFTVPALQVPFLMKNMIVENNTFNAGFISLGSIEPIKISDVILDNNSGIGSSIFNLVDGFTDVSFEKITAKNNNVGTIFNVNSSIQSDEISFKDIVCEGNTTSTRLLQVAPGTPSKLINIDNLTIKNHTGGTTGHLLLLSGDEINYTNSTIENSTAPTGILTYSTGELNIKNSVFKGNDFLDAGLNIDAVNLGLENVIIENNKARRLFTTSSTGTSSFEGVNVLNNDVLSGGGFLLSAQLNQASINACNFRNNTCLNGVMVTASSKALFDNCLFENNNSSNGLLTISGKEYSMLNSSFIGNKNTAPFSSLSTFSCVSNILDNVTYKDNESTTFLLSSNYGIKILNSSFVSNSLNNGVKGFLSTQNGVYKNVEISNNEVVLSGGGGGGFFFDYGDFQMDNVLIENNQVLVLFNRMHFIGGGKITNSVIRNNTFDHKNYSTNPNVPHFFFGNVQMIKNCIITGNKTDKTDVFFSGFSSSRKIINSVIYNNRGAKKMTEGNTNLQFYNSIIWNNDVPDINLNGDVKYCNIQIPVVGEGNLNIEPQFVDPVNGDFSLACSSPLINKGSNTYAPDGLDLAGLPRISAGIVDMGAYEFDGDPAVANATPVPDFSL